MLTTTLQVAASLVTVHLIAKLTAGDAGSLSVSTLQKISIMSNKVCSVPHKIDLFHLGKCLRMKSVLN